MGERQLSPFYRFGPRIDISSSGNLGRFSQKFHGHGVNFALFMGISGVWGAKRAPHCWLNSPHRPTLPRQLPFLSERNM